MPTPTQLRRERIKKLAAEFTDYKGEFVDPIFEKAKVMFPTVKKQTLKSYAQAVLRLIKWNQKK